MDISAATFGCNILFCFCRIFPGAFKDLLSTRAMIYPTIIVTTVEKAARLPLPVFASMRQEVVWSERSKSCRHLLSHVLAEAGPHKAAQNVYSNQEQKRECGEFIRADGKRCGRGYVVVYVVVSEQRGGCLNKMGLSGYIRLV